MNRWEDSFKKPSTNDTQCHCSSNQGLFIPNRQLSAIVAVCLLICFVIFMSGYFLGKKKVVEQFTQNVQQEAFVDQIYASVLAAGSEDQSSSHELLVTCADDAINASCESINQDIVLAEEAHVEKIHAQENNERYYAQLIGFGTEKAAQLFVKKLAAKGIETELKKRTSKTAKGNVSYWYQVVTMAYADKNELSALVGKLAKEENIKDACIRVC